MAKKDVPDPGRGTLLEAIARYMGGFFRRLIEEANAPSAREQELATNRARLDEIEARLDEIEKAAEEHSTDDQRLLDAISTLTEEMVAIRQTLTPEEVPRWKAALKKTQGTDSGIRISQKDRRIA